MNYHNEMMNIQESGRRELIACSGQGALSYKYGHRDARHAAAEIALKADTRIEELEQVLREVLPELRGLGRVSYTATNLVSKINDLLENKP